PYVEKHYRVRAGREHRALAGLSMGGGQTLHAVTTRPGQFAYAAVWSAGLFGGSAEDFEKQNAAFFKDPKKVNKGMKLFSISVGDKDFALAGSKALAGVLKKHGIEHELHVSGGGHTWINWRRYLHDLAPRLFRDGQAEKGNPSADATTGLPTARPEDVGVSAERLRRIDEVVKRHIADHRIAGAVTLVARRGKVIHFEAHGRKDIGEKQDMRKDTMFRMASSTKPVTGVAVMMLVEEGKVRLADPVSKFVPELKASKVAVEREGKVELV